MYLDDPSVKESLLRMTGSMTPNFAFRQDLLQEAWIHLWLTETRRPGQTKIASLLLKLEGPSFPREQFRGASAGEDSKQADGVLRTDPAKRVNGAKWSDGLKQNNDTNGTTRPSIVPEEAIPSTRCNGFL